MRRLNATNNRALCLLILSAALWPLTPAWGDAPIGRFVIGGWAPAGWSGARYPSYDRFFTRSDADSLSELGINLLVSTPRIGWRDVDGLPRIADSPRRDRAYTIMQNLEQTVLDLFKEHGGLVVEQPADAVMTANSEQYTSEFPKGDRLIDFAGDPNRFDTADEETADDTHKLNAQVTELVRRWGGATNRAGFFGYFVGHEQYPRRDGNWRGGI